MKRFTLYIFLLIIVISCSKKNENPLVSESEITISTEFFGSIYYVYGYSFELAKSISSQDTKLVSDIVATRIQYPDGTVLGAQLTAGSNNPYGFNKLGDFATLQAANAYYDAYKEVKDSAWESLSDTLVPFQVYAFRTYRDNFVKFMITGVTIVNAATPSDNYVEIDLKYFIQRDGSAIFSE